MSFRTFFTCASLVVLFFYFTQVLCRVPEDLKNQLTYEQQGVLWLILTLFCFNDPLYPVHIYSPSFMTYALTELSGAIFIASLLIYWLREFAAFRPRSIPADWGCIKRTVFACQGVNQCAKVYLFIFFFVLVADFMVLNCYYYIYVQGDPSLAGRFDLES